TALSSLPLHDALPIFGNASGRPNVVLLDQHHVEQAEAMIRPATRDDSLLFEGPQSRSRLTGVENGGSGTRDGIDVAARLGGDTRSEEHTSELQSRENL